MAKHIPGHGAKEADLLLMFKKMAQENDSEGVAMMLWTWEVRGDKQAVNLHPLHLCCAI